MCIDFDHLRTGVFSVVAQRGQKSSQGILDGSVESGLLFDVSLRVSGSFMPSARPTEGDRAPVALWAVLPWLAQEKPAS
jgi:hypothetical protein